MKPINIIFTTFATLATSLPPLGLLTAFAGHGGQLIAAGAVCGVVAAVLGNISGSILNPAGAK